ncbi:HU family DNA-binding protein [Gaoshiqia sediminis]|uniref:HU family DNA-binding protein n=1 Tax=Gaoshiqia sediminis TaxID=2986998 RepID=A0AA41YAD7_9BACT|nr:HU family DNA-binding protein [Gaoshiqia sediminis]MCW0482230.1 HU family DNA-binding protein [Gaoshiqia sediminis]
MTVKYRLVKQATPGVKGGGHYKYYARACDRRKITLDELADMLEKRSSLSRGDIIGTLVGMIDLIPDLLLNNHTIELGQLGTFSLNLKSHASEEPRTDGFRLIKSADISFRPSPRLKQAVKYPDYTKSKTSDY